MRKFRNPQTGAVADVADAIVYHYRSHGWEEIVEEVPDDAPEQEPPASMTELLADLEEDGAPNRKGKKG